MTVDKRKVSTDALETLGMIIDDTQKRDAIHLAVEPVKAKERLLPGQDVDATGSTKGTLVGIVDPFLKEEAVEEGQWFWLVLYPRQINSLRHVWTHPDFPDKEDIINESKKWMENCVKDINNSIKLWLGKPDMTYKKLMKIAYKYTETDEPYHITGYDCLPNKFWDHYMIITGKEVPEHKRNNFFRCYC